MTDWLPMLGIFLLFCLLLILSWRYGRSVRRASSPHLPETIKKFLSPASADRWLLLHGSLENINQGISVIDSRLQLVAWNQRYKEMFGYPEELVQQGRHISELIRFNAERGLCGPGSPEQHVRKRLEWLKKGTAHRSERKRQDGRVIQVQGNPLPAGGFVMSFSDITEFRRVERKLKAANEQLELRVQERTQALEKMNRDLLQAKRQSEQANNSRSRFFAAISHDLMQPMHAARLFTATLLEKEVADDVAETISGLDSSLQSAEDLLKDLQDLSRIESGRLSYTVKPFAIADLLKQLKTEFGMLAERHQVQFRCMRCDHTVISDPTLLRRILQNFLANAFRYARQGEVALNCVVSEQGLRLEINDNGPGIPRHKQEEVFRAFRRLDDTDTQGLGLGLAIARGMAQVLNHEIGLQSQVGKGSRFYVTVPLASSVAERQPVTERPVSSLAGLTLLCIENDEQILSGLQSLLGSWQCHVLTARDRDEALQAIGRERPEVILADYHLDTGNGHELVRLVQDELKEALPAIIITADGSPRLRAQLKAEGLGYLPKPVKPAALRALLSQLVNPVEA